MSIENNVKVTTKKLQKKYTSTSWGYLMDLILSSDAFSTSLYQLMSDRKAGQSFIPKFGSIFRSFDLCKLEKAKIVVIGNVPAQSGADGLAFSEDKINPFTKEIADITTYTGDQRSLEYLPQEEGVMLLNASLTAPMGEYAPHTAMWEPIIKQMIDQIGYRTNKTIFVFVGFRESMIASILLPLAFFVTFIVGYRSL
jgi:uracil DNA glycosylase